MWNELPDRLKLSDETYSASAERISNSHRRCEQLGLQRDIPYARDVLNMRGIEEKNNGLITFSNLLFASTFDRLPDKRILLTLTDAHAKIIAIHSGPAVIRASADKGVCLGASVGEGSIGTNAVSLALHDLEPTILRGEQHYCHMLHDWCCVAIPLIDTHGAPMGCLDISMDHEAALGEKFALASSLAKELSSFAIRHQRPAFKPRDLINVDLNETEIRLTERQRQVLELYSQGLTYKQIARHLQLQSAKTVQEHLDVVRAKLGATSRRDSIRKAVEQGFLSN